MRKILLICTIICCLLFAACGEKNILSSSDSSDSYYSTADLSTSDVATTDTGTTSKPSGATTTAPKTTTTAKITTTTPAPVSVTIPEGYTFARIAQAMEQAGVCSQQSLYNIINTYPFQSSPVGKNQVNTSSRPFRLEGYLFASTYQFYKNEKPENVLGKLLQQNEKSVISYISSNNKTGRSIDDVIIVASILQKESTPAEYANVASVIYNRLGKGYKLQCDSTIKYVTGCIQDNSFYTGDKNQYNSLINTYKCSGLPSTPICNPSINAIKAACNPASTKYFYFFSDSSGAFYYSATYTEHQQQMSAHGVSENKSQVTPS